MHAGALRLTTQRPAVLGAARGRVIAEGVLGRHRHVAGMDGLNARDSIIQRGQFRGDLVVTPGFVFGVGAVSAGGDGGCDGAGFGGQVGALLQKDFEFGIHGSGLGISGAGTKHESACLPRR